MIRVRIGGRFNAGSWAFMSNVPYAYDRKDDCNLASSKATNAPAHEGCAHTIFCLI